MSGWHIAALAFAGPAAWYIQWLVRWGAGPFGVLDTLRRVFLGAVVLQDASGDDYHQPVRSKLSAVGLLECAKCTSFWVGLALAPVVWFAPFLVVVIGIMGAASLLDAISER